MITGMQPPVSDEWVHSNLNRPFKFAAGCDLTAPELFDRTPDEIHGLLTGNAKMHYLVDKLMRKSKWRQEL
jgi:hypothetical protein